MKQFLATVGKAVSSRTDTTRDSRSCAAPANRSSRLSPGYKRLLPRVGAFAYALLCGSACFVAQAQHNDPQELGSRRDIVTANKAVDDISISRLPIEDYPLLSKFTLVKRVRFLTINADLVTDDKLKALASLGFTNLIDITLLNCAKVSDEGIRALSRIGSIRMLQLEGTGVGDEGLAFMASKMAITGVNIANCDRVTSIGIRSLGSAQTLTNLTFSAGIMTTKDILGLIRSFKNVSWCQIIDPGSKLDAKQIKTELEGSRIRVFVRKTGALQDLGLRP